MVSSRKKDLRLLASEWIRTYPEIYALFVTFAKQMMRRGRPFGIKLLAERVRWEVTYTWGAEKYELNNSLVAYIARQLLIDVPELVEWINTRKTRC